MYVFLQVSELLGGQTSRPRSSHSTRPSTSTYTETRQVRQNSTKRPASQPDQAKHTQARIPDSELSQHADYANSWLIGGRAPPRAYVSTRTQHRDIGKKGAGGKVSR